MPRWVALMALLAAVGCSSSAVSADVHTESAFSACQHFVNQQLRSPGSAKYPDPLTDTNDVTTVTTVKGDVEVATFISHVDSENGFGALLRSNFTCNVHTTDGGDTWESDGVTVDPG